MIAAAHYGMCAYVDRILDRGVNVDATSEQGPYYTAIQAAAAGGNVGALEILLKAHANVNLAGGAHGTPLCAAVRARRDRREIF